MCAPTQKISRSATSCYLVYIEKRKKRLEKYQNVDEGGDSKSPEAANVCVGDVSSGDRSDPHDTGPVIYISNRRNRVFMKSRCQIIHQIRSYSIKRHPLTRFIPFSNTNKTT